MKNVLVSFCTSVFAIVTFASDSVSSMRELLPAEHTTCLNANEMWEMAGCSEGTQFFTAHDGRCGCLTQQAVTPPHVCMSSFFRCDINAGEAYSALYQYRSESNLPEYAGCGCFTTFDGVSATALPN